MLDVPDEEVVLEKENGLGALLLAMLPGTMALFLVDPDSAPDGTRMAAGMRSLLGEEGPAPKA